jgi:hypothetical protein
LCIECTSASLLTEWTSLTPSSQPLQWNYTHLAPPRAHATAVWCRSASHAWPEHYPGWWDVQLPTCRRSGKASSCVQQTGRHGPQENGNDAQKSQAQSYPYLTASIKHRVGAIILHCPGCDDLWRFSLTYTSPPPRGCATQHTQSPYLWLGLTTGNSLKAPYWEVVGSRSRGSGSCVPEGASSGMLSRHMYDLW